MVSVRVWLTLDVGFAFHGAAPTDERVFTVAKSRSTDIMCARIAVRLTSNILVADRHDHAKTVGAAPAVDTWIATGHVFAFAVRVTHDSIAQWIEYNVRAVAQSRSALIDRAEETILLTGHSLVHLWYGNAVAIDTVRVTTCGIFLERVTVVDNMAFYLGASRDQVLLADASIGLAKVVST